VRLELATSPDSCSPRSTRSPTTGNLLHLPTTSGEQDPRGRIPVEVDFEATPERFEGIVEALRSEGVNVMQAGTERYAEEVTLLLFGHLIDTDLSDTLADRGLRVGVRRRRVAGGTTGDRGGVKRPASPGGPRRRDGDGACGGPGTGR